MAILGRFSWFFQGGFLKNSFISLENWLVSVKKVPSINSSCQLFNKITANVFAVILMGTVAFETPCVYLTRPIL